MSYVVSNKAILTKNGTKDIGEAISKDDFKISTSFDDLVKRKTIVDAADFKKIQEAAKTMPSGNTQLDAANKKIVELENVIENLKKDKK